MRVSRLHSTERIKAPNRALSVARRFVSVLFSVPFTQPSGLLRVDSALAVPQAGERAYQAPTRRSCQHMPSVVYINTGCVGISSVVASGYWQAASRSRLTSLQRHPLWQCKKRQSRWLLERSLHDRWRRCYCCWWWVC
eukprot:jgi/Chlat1/2676/Chrsp18S02991